MNELQKTCQYKDILMLQASLESKMSQGLVNKNVVSTTASSLDLQNNIYVSGYQTLCFLSPFLEADYDIEKTLLSPIF